jgi:hypothetical protein
MVGGQVYEYIRESSRVIQDSSCAQKIGFGHGFFDSPEEKYAKTPPFVFRRHPNPLPLLMRQPPSVASDVEHQQHSGANTG